MATNITGLNFNTEQRYNYIINGDMLVSQRGDFTSASAAPSYYAWSGDVELASKPNFIV